VDEEDVVEQTELFQQRGADKAVKVGTGYQAVANGGSRGYVHPLGIGSRDPVLSYAFAAEHHGHQHGVDEVATITPYRDGPLLVRGRVRLTDQNGEEIAIERETIALCRCGKSRLRPFCDGTHKLIRFRAPTGPEDGRATG
jgi:CDGSH-type Zn-finger protein